MSKILILSINNISNYLFAKFVIENTIHNVTCLLIDEPNDLVEHLIQDWKERITLIGISSDILEINSEVLGEIYRCDYAFLDTHYQRHSNPILEINEWKLLANIFNSSHFTGKNIVVTNYEDTRPFAKYDVDIIHGFTLPRWDSRAEGVNKLDVSNNIIKYIYPALFYDEIISLIRPDNTLNKTTATTTTYQITLPITGNLPLYAIDRVDYIKACLKLLIQPGKQKNDNSHYKITGELLDFNFITNFIEQCSGKIVRLVVENSLEENNITEKEWYNYFIINSKYHNTKIMRDYDLARYLIDDSTCFYNWLKQKDGLNVLYKFRNNIFNSD